MSKRKQLIFKSLKTCRNRIRSCVSLKYMSTFQERLVGMRVENVTVFRSFSPCQELKFGGGGFKSSDPCGTSGVKGM